MQKTLLAFLALAFTACVNTRAGADIAYSNFGPGDSYTTFSTGFGNLTDYNSQATNYHLARGFTSEVTGRLSSIELPMGLIPNFTNTMPGRATLTLWSHQTSTTSVGKPNEVLWSGDSELVSNIAQDFSIYEISADPGAPVLQQGTIYWFIASAKDGTVPLAWAQNDDPFHTGRYAYSLSDNINWLGEVMSTEMAFRVNVTSVPEPTSAIGAVVFCLGMVLRRRKCPMANSNSIAT